jgi:hypothetical protein
MTSLADERTVADDPQTSEQRMAMKHMPVWSAHLPSRMRLRRPPKRQFVAPSLALAAGRRPRTSDQYPTEPCCNQGPSE